MIILIDAYNILKQWARTDYVSAGERERFIKMLAEYGQRKNHIIIIVFDGGEYDRPFQERHDSVVRVIYSGYLESADDTLEQLMQQHHGRDVALVSSDRALCSYAAKLSIPSIDSRAFFEQVSYKETPLAQVKYSPHEAARKADGHVSSDELDTLMHKAASIIVFKAEDAQACDTPEPVMRRTSSKTVKKLRAVVKKL